MPRAPVEPEEVPDKPVPVLPEEPEEPEDWFCASASWLLTVPKTLWTVLPSEARTEMATTEMKARMSAYSTRVWPRFIFAFRKSVLITEEDDFSSERLQSGGLKH